MSRFDTVLTSVLEAIGETPLVDLGRITRGLKPACVEVCPTEARIFGDLKDPATDHPLRRFFEKNRVQTLKPHLGTEPRVQYANIDKEVR